MKLKNPLIALFILILPSLSLAGGIITNEKTNGDLNHKTFEITGGLGGYKSSDKTKTSPLLLAFTFSLDQEENLPRRFSSKHQDVLTVSGFSEVVYGLDGPVGSIPYFEIELHFIRARPKIGGFNKDRNSTLGFHFGGFDLIKNDVVNLKQGFSFGIGELYLRKHKHLTADVQTFLKSVARIVAFGSFETSNTGDRLSGWSPTANLKLGIQSKKFRVYLREDVMTVLNPFGMDNKTREEPTQGVGFHSKSRLKIDTMLSQFNYAFAQGDIDVFMMNTQTGTDVQKTRESGWQLVTGIGGGW